MNWKKIAQIGVPSAAFIGMGVVTSKLYRYGFGRLDEHPTEQTDNNHYHELYQRAHEWFDQQPTENWWLYDDDPKNRIHAIYLPHPEPTKKVVVIAHGYHGSAPTMAAFAKMYQDLGYNVLMPDNRGHGESSGNWVNFGGLDRLDYRDWCLDLVDYLGDDCEIVLFGVSMGGAIVMMMSGEDLPPQVKGIIEDCGYSSLPAQLTYRAKVEFHLPKFPILQVVNLINHFVLGFNIDDVDSLAALAKNTRPIFFIHGEDDTYVPTSMCLENYRATSAPKELWLVPKANHAESFPIDPAAYQKKVAWFLKKYGL